jgi:hypothetical protein
MKKIMLMILLSFGLMLSCKEEPENLFDVYFLQGLENDVILFDFEKFFIKYPEKSDVNTMSLKADIIENGNKIVTIDNIVKCGYKHFYKINILKLDKIGNKSLVIKNSIMDYQKKLKDIDDITKEKFKFALMNDVSIEKQVSDRVDFIINSLRIREIPNEYLPTSEKIALRISNEKGSEIYSSSYGMNFLMVISNVKPEKVGEIKREKISWNYKNNDGKRVGKGKYSIDVIIPARPEPYIERTTIIID